MSFDSNTLKTRTSLWIALSDLFLDTELKEFNYLYIAKAMKESGYTLAEIESILMLEVFPICIANLHSVAGEWASFDKIGLCETIISAKRPNRFRRWMNRRSFSLIKHDWQKVVETYKQL